MKKILAFLLATTMIFGAAACTTTPSGDDETTPADVTDTTAGDETTPSEDEVEVPVGKITNFPSLTYIYNTNDGHKAIAEYLQGALANVGITMQLTNQEWNTFLNTRKNGEYSVARNGWVADYNDPICFLDMWVSGSGNNDIQFGKGDHADLAMYNLDLTPYGYETKVENGTWAETYDVLISAIKAETDNVKRYAMMHLAEDMLMDTGCIVPIYYYTDLYMIDESINGFFSNPLGYKYFMNTTVEGVDALNICLASEPDTLDPALNSAVDGATMIAHLFSGLAKWDQDENGKLVIVPDLAEDLPEGVVNEDGTVTYTYTLKEGLTWSNGDPLTAADFVFAWNRAASADLAADYGYMFELVKGYADVSTGVEGAKLAVEATDDRTLVVTINNAAAYWNELLAFPTFAPVHEATVANEAWATEPETYIGNGAYTISAWTHDSVITLTKNENYHAADEVTMPTINCYLSDDATNMLTNFKNGDWLFIDDVPTDEIDTLKVDFPTEFVIAGQIGTYYVCWNVNEKILPADSTLTGVEAEAAQAEIRKAISLFFDRDYICKSVAKGGQVSASSFVAMGLTDADGSEFYKNCNQGDFDGYFNLDEDAWEANYESALKTLAKYYTFDGVAAE